jgi:serine/threonine protein phosphatase PrpC
MTATIPTRPEPVPCVGVCSIKGNVRARNEDAADSFSFSGRHSVVVADGCGGLPDGDLASRCAVTAARRELLRSSRATPQPSLQRAAELAIAAASTAVSETAKLRGFGPGGDKREDGFRTTLIVVVADGEHYGFAYIGDGGGWIRRGDGTIERFLLPQKAEGRLDVLTASLGPEAQGEPISGTLARRPGDLLLVGTDGVFDRVDDQFAHAVHARLDELRGDAVATAQFAVRQLAEFADEAGYFCDDNLSLGLLTTARLNAHSPTTRTRDDRVASRE